MDGWPATDTNVPDILQFENLPTLIEKYLEEAGGKPIVCRAQFKRGNSVCEEGGYYDLQLC
jgi:hypothetical protein